MKKVLILFIVVGVLLTGTFVVAEELSESSCEKSYFSESDLGDPQGGPTPCGGGSGGGPGGVPG